MKSPLSLKRRLLLWLGVALVALVPAGSLGLYAVMLNTAVAWLDQGLGDGRIYRIVHESKKPGPQPRLSHASPAQLVATLSHPNG